MRAECVGLELIVVDDVHHQLIIVAKRSRFLWREYAERQALRDAVPQFFKGTSNVHLARTLGLVPIGTMAHEYLQSYQALDVRLRDHQRAGLESWVQAYRGLWSRRF